MVDLTRKDKLTVVANAEQQNKKERFIGSVMPHKGQKVFELDKSTGNICIAEFEKTTANFPLKSSDGVGVNKKILAKENCIYVLAINLLNAKKKFAKILRQQSSKVSHVNCIACNNSIQIKVNFNNNVPTEVVFEECFCGHVAKIQDYVK